MKEKDPIALTVFKKKKSFLSDFGDNANTFSTLTSTVLLCFLHLLGHAGNLCRGQALCSARDPPIGLVRLALFSGEKSREKGSEEAC